MMRRGAEAEKHRGTEMALPRRILDERKTASRRWDGAAAALKPESNLILVATLALGLCVSAAAPALI